MATGRNDPCPCGSGKKHKRCCLARAEMPVDVAWYRLRRVADDLQSKLAAHGRQLRGEHALLRAWHEFVLWQDEPFDPEGPHLSAFLSWFFFSWAPDPREDEEGGEIEVEGLGEDEDVVGAAAEAEPDPDLVDLDDEPTIAESYLERHHRRLDPLEREYLERASQAPLSFFEVLDVVPQRSVRLRDILVPGEEIDVMERSASQVCKPGDILYAMVVQAGDVAILVGSGSVLIPPGQKAPIIELRAAMRGPREAPNPVDLLLWEEKIRELYFAIYANLHAPPRLANTDGEPLSLHTLTWNIESPEAAFAALRSLAGEREDAELLASAERDQAGGLRKVAFSWVRPGNGMHAGWDETVLGHVSIDGSRLTIEVNSQARAERVRSEVEARLGARAVHRSTTAQSPEALLREREGRGGGRDAQQSEEAREAEQQALLAIPEVRAKIREMTVAHWEAWVDQPIPALGGRTPRQATETADGREALDALLLDFERQADPADPARDPADIVRLRKRLGLAVATG